MALLIGEFEQAIDPAKHRLSISAGLREQINPEEDGKGFIVVLGPDLHLWLYPDEYYRRLLVGLRPSPLPDRHAEDIRLLFGMARPVRPDSQGRVVLPEKLMERARVSDRVTLVGVFDHIEIWPTDEWDQHVARALPTYGQVLCEASDRMRAESRGPA